MYTLLKNKNLLLSILVLSSYVIFTVLFWDILKGEVFHLGTTSLFLLILFSIFFISSLVQIKKYSYKLTDKNVIVILLTTIIFSLFIQNTIHISQTIDLSKKKFYNPLYKKFTKIAKQHNLDLIFTKESWIQRGPNNYKTHTLFQKDKKSVDILFIGDSSMTWGVIPEVIEQMTNKSVAIYAYESNALTKKTSILFNKISEYYLKDNGMVILSFSNWLLDQDTNSVLISQNEYQDMIKWTNADFQKLQKSHSKKKFDLYLSYKSFQKRYNYTSEYLKVTSSMYLKSPNLYSNYFEPLINSKLSKNKAKNKERGTSYLRWNMNTVTRYNLGYYQRPPSIYSDKQHTQNYKNNNAKDNAVAASKIYAPQKVYMVPIYSTDDDYIKSRSIYNTYYKKLNFIVSDLGEMHPKDIGYPMSNGAHMANEGGLMKSILIGKWLNQYYKKQN